jgi:arsenate reductase
MEELVLYHNPRCSKSRKALELLENSGKEFQIVEYLKEGIEPDALCTLSEKLGLKFQDFTRTKENVFSELGLGDKNLSQNDWAEIISQNPILLERPIISGTKTAVIARPPELVLEFIEKHCK